MRKVIAIEDSGKTKIFEETSTLNDVMIWLLSDKYWKSSEKGVTLYAPDNNIGEVKPEKK